MRRRFRPATIGEMNTRITLESPTLTDDPGGAQSNSPINQGQVWAKWVNAHGSEAIQDDALQATRRATVTIRWRGDVNETWTVVKGGQRYRIVSPPDNIREKRAYIELQVERTDGSA